MDDLDDEVEPVGPPRGTLTVLGCDGSYPGPGGAGSSYLVRSGETTLWLDAGPGSFANLQRYGDPAEIDAVILSHEHPDHWSDFESFVVWASVGERKQTIPVYAPPGLHRRSYFAEHPAIDWQVTVPGQQVEVGDLSCRFEATDHGPPTLAVRIDSTAGGAPELAGSALVYSADTGPEWSVESLGWALGTFLCEATFTRDREGFPGHLSGRQAGAMAADADVRRLVLTHRWPTVSAEAVDAEASSTFGAPVEHVEVGTVIEW